MEAGATRTRREAGAARAPRGSGWVMYAAILFLILGTFNVIDGIAALTKDAHFADDLFFAGLPFWGVVMLIIGGLQLFAAFQLFDGRGQYLGIFLLFLNLVAQLFLLPAYPVWSIIIMVINGMAIYGLTVYGEEFAP
jgi:hypothetical protein